MPKKLNFLGGMQNYNEHTGEYESALTGANGKVVKDADGDGKSHEGERDFNDPKERESLKEEAKEFNAPKKHDYSQIFDEDYERSWGPQEDEEKVYDDIEILKQKADKNGLDFERSVLNDIKADPEKYSKFELDGVRYEKEGNGWHIYEGKAHSFGTANSVANKIAQRKEETKYPKGTSKEYTDKVNESYNKALPVLEKAGIKLEEFKGEKNSQGGFDTNAKEIMDKYVFDPFREKYPSGNNEVWEREYKPLYEAIDSVLDKQYNDWYIKNAPLGY